MKRTGFIAITTALVFALAGYIVQCFTPMRLEEDAVVYLTMASSALHGMGFLYLGNPSPFPPGYPVIVWLLSRAGLGSSVFLNFLNVAAAGAGLAAVVSVARRRGLPMQVPFFPISACVFSFAMVKGTSMQLSDVCCFGITLWAVALAESAAARTSGTGAWLRWGAALMLAAAAFSMRMAGIAILAATLLESLRAAWRAPGRARLVAALTVAAGVVGACSALIFFFLERKATGGGYLSSLTEYADRSAFAIIGDHFSELGEMLLNIPNSKAGPQFAPLYLATGLLNGGLIAWLVYRDRRHWPPGRTFLLFYSVMVFAYPRYCELRVWLPAIPLFALEIAVALSRLPSGPGVFLRKAGIAYSSYFVATGFVALGYSVWLTFSTHALVEAPLIRFYRNEYRVWLLDQPETPGLDTRILPILREFGGTRPSPRKPAL